MTLGELIRKYIEEARPQGTKLGVLQRLLDRPIARRNATKLKARDYIEHCRERRRFVAPSTAVLDINYINSVLVYARVVLEMEKVSSASLVDVKPLLSREGLIGSSRKRWRRPSNDEIERLKTHFRASKSGVPMADIIEFSLKAGRRISETCRITWGDYDPARRVVVVRDVKHPKQKAGNDKESALLPEADEIIRRQPRRTTNPDERIFPYSDRYISTLYYEAKKKLGIRGLTLHDNRGECSTRLIEAGYSVPEIMLVTLHDDPKTLLTRYNKLRPEALLNGPASRRVA